MVHLHELRSGYLATLPSVVLQLFPYSNRFVLATARFSGMTAETSAAGPGYVGWTDSMQKYGSKGDIMVEGPTSLEYEAISLAIIILPAVGDI